MQGEGLSVRAVTAAGPSDTVWPTRSFLWRTEATPISLTSLSHVVRATSLDIGPPPAHLIIRDARGDLRRGRYRKAVVDAGSAAEIAISDRHRSHPSVTPRPFPRRPTLGTYVKYAVLPLPEATQDHLVRVRNDAIHNGLKPTRSQAEDAVRIALQIVQELQPLFGSDYSFLNDSP